MPAQQGGIPELATGSQNPIVFRRNARIGEADAENDDFFLEECFVDNGDLAVLRDCSDPKCIVLGHTGSGKTAILKKLLASEERSFELSPEVLSLNYISNSTIIQFFDGIGVRLDYFYTLLWRHVLTVELLKKRYDIYNENNQNAFLSQLYSVFARHKAKARSIDYLKTWGEAFWEETEYRVKEFTTKLESELRGSLTGTISPIEIGAEGARRLSEDQRTEIIRRSNNVVNQTQVKELADVINLLAGDIFTDKRKRYYVVIDRLDEGWAEDKIRYKLIKYLIETIRSFRKVQPVKIVIALRIDLLKRVIEQTRSSGFQEEKYNSLFLNLGWSRNQLKQLLDYRVNYLFKMQYTKNDVLARDIFSDVQIDKKEPIDYIIDRTFHRPREAILFLNECIQQAEGRARISKGALRSAEISYSQKRLCSLTDEWRANYPMLVRYVTILTKRTCPFTIQYILDRDADNLCNRLCDTGYNPEDPMYLAAEQFFLGRIDKETFLTKLFHILYEVGVVGVKPATYITQQWSYIHEPVLAEGQLSVSSPMEVHPTFWSALGISRGPKGG